ncbi:cyclin-dependent protein kinase inhibitor SMR3-like [Olea europaea var. sylvestris]|uniref:Cyclin-dependent protein kinase inhibitor SMR3 n=1 Tax=Olea europaea subsp. europaea TaxID=158383 RepID=A0A8S0R656_OLEEU|nr:cyclin-dependent protein kinase inhibitor SMR3-like [Olea europaea var. sylvestris]CAA2974248.1 Hypothetical predicted protein [Olea europaea subsp. europaea]
MKKNIIGLRMSNKNNLIKEEEKEIKKDSFSESQLENIEEGEGNEEKKPEDEKVAKILCLGESEVAEDDDGFKTPTSSDNKIPVMTQCPPAPKKIRPEPSMKRKASSPPRSLQFDVPAAEVDSIFSPISKDQKFKKPRRDHNED